VILLSSCSTFHRDKSQAWELWTLYKGLACQIQIYEMGGWPEANWVQAADRHMEVNIDFFLSTIGRSQSGWTLDTIRTRPDWMYYRMQIREACALAVPRYEVAL
jgi:hypothetical protein